MSGAGLDVAVVGGGPAGLAAAWRLTGSGARVTLYEAREEVAGRLRTIEMEGARCDVAVQLLASYYTSTLRLVRDVGAGEILRRASGRDALWRRGRAHPVEYGSPTSMLLSGVLPAGLKLRLATRYMAYLSRHAVELDPVEFATRAAHLDGESIAEWGERELGSDFVELLAYPTLAAYYGSTPEETGAPFFHSLARGGLNLQLVSVRGGMAELGRAVADALRNRGARIVTGCRIERAEVRGGAVTLSWADGESHHDAAVLAVPPGALNPLIGETPELGEWLAGVRTRPAAALALAFEGRLPGDWFGLSFPRIEPAGQLISAVCVQERKGAQLVAAEKGALVVFPAPVVAERVARAEPREVMDLLLSPLDVALPGIGERVQRARVIRFQDGGVLFYPGYLAHLGRFQHGWTGSRLVLAGDYLVAPTVEGAVRSGERAADRILAGE